MKKVYALCALLLLVASPVYAKRQRQADNENYVAVKLGQYFPQASDMEGFDSGLNGEVAFGHYFSPNVALEFSVGYFESKGVFTDENTGQPFSMEFTTYPILLNIKGVMPFKEFELYALAGGGAYITNLKTSGQGGSIDSNDTAFGYQFGIGGNYNFSENIFVGLEGKYFWAKPTFNFLNLSVEGSIDGIQATVNFGYRF